MISDTSLRSLASDSSVPGAAFLDSAPPEWIRALDGWTDRTRRAVAPSAPETTHGLQAFLRELGVDGDPKWGGKLALGSFGVWGAWSEHPSSAAANRLHWLERLPECLPPESWTQDVLPTIPAAAVLQLACRIVSWRSALPSSLALRTQAPSAYAVWRAGCALCSGFPGRAAEETRDFIVAALKMGLADENRRPQLLRWIPESCGVPLLGKALEGLVFDEDLRGENWVGDLESDPNLALYWMSAAFSSLPTVEVESLLFRGARNPSGFEGNPEVERKMGALYAWLEAGLDLPDGRVVRDSLDRLEGCYPRLTALLEGRRLNLEVPSASSLRRMRL